MKDYLQVKLTKDEEEEILGIIWMVHRNHKHQLFKKQRREVPLVEDIDNIYEECYGVEKIIFQDYKDSLTPLGEKEKTEIVNQLNNVMDDLCLYEIKRALTFNEKLVFFFVLMENYKQEKVAFLLSIGRKTIYNRVQSVKTKIECIKEAMQ